MSAVTRRSWLRGALAGSAGVAVWGFDPQGRGWLTAAQAGMGGVRLPTFDGSLTTDPDALQAAADDFGHIVSRVPTAVLSPASVADVVRAVRFARRHRIHVAMRGQGHSQFGQAQVSAGLVIDMSSLSAIHHLGGDAAEVDAGVTWAQLVRAALSQGLTPPVLTDYLHLSVGGTLAVGGIGGATQHFGLQADNVLELEVVTGRGQRLRCSRRRRPALFEAALTGLGQSALIVRAKLRLVPAHAQAQVFHLYYDDLSAYVADQLRLLHERRFDYLEGQVVPSESGGWRFMIEAAKYTNEPALPDPNALLAGLNDQRGAAEMFSQTYEEFAFRLDPFVEYLQSIGAWQLPHPWFSVWVPASRAVQYVDQVLSELTVADTGEGPILFYPVRRSRVRRRLYRLPREPWSFAFNILRTAVPPTPETIAHQLAQNDRFYDQLAAMGGTRYAIGALPFSKRDWRQHFGHQWPFLVRSKRRFDPLALLTPGQGIFS